MTLQPLQRRSGSSTFAVFTLFGDYLVPYCDGQAWTQDLIYLLGLLGMPERTARTTLTRMKDRGWLDATRDGRRSRYGVTKLGRSVLEQGRQRIFEPATVGWDERWQVVVYSLPDELRTQRDEFRKKLVWFGFGNLAGGTWVAAHDRQTELDEIAFDLGIESYVVVFNSHLVGSLSNRELVARCWNLDALEEKYRRFIADWQPRMAQFVDGVTSAEIAPNPEFNFQESLWLTFDFQPFPRIDPNLPAALLPTDWPGHQARELFQNYRQRLRFGLPDFFQNM